MKTKKKVYVDRPCVPVTAEMKRVAEKLAIEKEWSFAKALCYLCELGIECERKQK